MKKKYKVFKVDTVGYSYARALRCSKYSWFRLFDEEVKKGNIMLNNKTYIAIATAGFVTQVFAYLCGGQLNAQTLANFNAFGSVAIFIAFLGYALNTMNDIERLKKDSENISEDFRRDFDAVYRYIDDCNRDTRIDIDNVSREFNDKRKR